MSKPYPQIEFKSDEAQKAIEELSQHVGSEEDRMQLELVLVRRDPDGKTVFAIRPLVLETK